LAIIKENFENVDDSQLAAMITEQMPLLRQHDTRPRILAFLADYSGDNK